MTEISKFFSEQVFTLKSLDIWTLLLCNVSIKINEITCNNQKRKKDLIEADIYLN